jgi:uncharacterized protein YbjT (DUF2867 family)
MSVGTDRPSAIIAGSTGLIGRALLRRLLDDRNSGTVHALVRRVDHGIAPSPRLLMHKVDFDRPVVLPLAYECYIALGTTIRQAGSQDAFRRVDFDTVFALAKAAKAAGVARLALVSALGADPNSAVFYNRVKGEAEEAVSDLRFERLVIARPSLLLGNRSAIGQRLRPLERVAALASRPLMPWMPSRWRPIDDAVVARALVRRMREEGPRVQVLESAELARLGRPG